MNILQEKGDEESSGAQKRGSDSSDLSPPSNLGACSQTMTFNIHSSSVVGTKEVATGLSSLHTSKKIFNFIKGIQL